MSITAPLKILFDPSKARTSPKSTTPTRLNLLIKHFSYPTVKKSSLLVIVDMKDLHGLWVLFYLSFIVLFTVKGKLLWQHCSVKQNKLDPNLCVCLYAKQRVLKAALRSTARSKLNSMSASSCLIANLWTLRVLQAKLTSSWGDKSWDGPFGVEDSSIECSRAGTQRRAATADFLIVISASEWREEGLTRIQSPSFAQTNSWMIMGC